MKLFELAGSEDDRRTSPYCWRIRFALALKAVPFHAEPWRGVEKDKIAFTGQHQVPVLVDGSTTIVDSWRIAEYLERTVPEAHSFFGSKEGKGGVKFIVHWLDHSIYPILMQIVCIDALKVSHEKDKTFFRNKWEYLHGMAIEEFAGCEHVPQFQQALQPMRIILEEQPYLGGTDPNFADLAVAGNFAWARAVSLIQLLEKADPVYAWRERMFSKFHNIVHPTIGYQHSLLPAQQVKVEQVSAGHSFLPAQQGADEQASAGQEQHRKYQDAGVSLIASSQQAYA